MPAIGPNDTSFAPGKKKSGGRPKGTPNKVTAEMKEGFLQAFKNKEPMFEKWLDEVAANDPAAACKIMVSMADFIFPRIGRTELVGDGGGPLEFVIRDLGSEAGGK
jgi:hypothetical protein